MQDLLQRLNGRKKYADRNKQSERFPRRVLPLIRESFMHFPFK